MHGYGDEESGCESSEERVNQGRGWARHCRRRVSPAASAVIEAVVAPVAVAAEIVANLLRHAAVSGSPMQVVVDERVRDENVGEEPRDEDGKEQRVACVQRESGLR